MLMTNQERRQEETKDELRPEYDLKSLRVRKLGPGRKYFGDIVRLEPDVVEAFPDDRLGVRRAMTENTEPKHISHKDKNIAYHMEWGFRREAAIWMDERPIGSNFHPLATELRNWMLRKGNVRFFSSEDKVLPYAFSNPYTYDGSILSVTYAQVINDSAAFAKDTRAADPDQVEIQRIRLYSENVLYAARLCEAFIKQLLFCTTFSEGDYRNSALGSLLSKDCNGCRSSKDKKHKISLLGSLAHRYHLCGPYEHCLNDHMKIANRRRNLEAAHSGVTKFTVQPAAKARNDLEEQLTSLGNDFIHMLLHISDIEAKMTAELKSRIRADAKRARVVLVPPKDAPSPANA